LLYPNVMPHLISTRKKAYSRLRSVFKLAHHKLGAYCYAGKLGVGTPRILYCGRAGDLLLSSSSLDNKDPNDDLAALIRRFGTNFVTKPLDGFGSKGVRVVADSAERMKLKQPYSDDAIVMVEERIRSGNPEYAQRIPPDYKFYAFGKGLEYATFNDKNLQPACTAFFDPNTANWTRVPGPDDGSNETNVVGNPICATRTRDYALYQGPQLQREMTNAVRRLLEPMDGSFVRVDMFETAEGTPVLGEFTPYPFNGNFKPYMGCLTTYLFLKHAGRYPRSDDADVLLREFTKLPMSSWQVGTPYRPKSWTTKFYVNTTSDQRRAVRDVVKQWIPDRYFEDDEGDNNNDNVNDGGDRSERALAGRFVHGNDVVDRYSDSATATTSSTLLRRRNLESPTTASTADTAGTGTGATTGQKNNQQLLKIFPEADGWWELSPVEQCRKAKAAQDEYFAASVASSSVGG